MTKEDITTKITTILCELMTLEPDAVQLDADLYQDLHMDSLDQVELVMAIEEEFGIDISDQEVETSKIKTVGDVVAGLVKRVGDEKARFPIEDGWLHMDLEMRSAKPISEAEIHEMVLMGRPAEGQEFGLVEQHGKQVKVILRERKKAGERV